MTALGVSFKAGLTLYRDGRRLFVDVNNTDIDLATDRIASSAPVAFSVALPVEMRDKPLRARVLSPDAHSPVAKLSQAPGGRVDVKLGPVALYACVIIEPAD